MCIKPSIFHMFCPITKKVKTVTPQFSLSFRKSMAHSTKYSKYRKMAKFQIEKFVFSSPVVCLCHGLVSVVDCAPCSRLCLCGP